MEKFDEILKSKLENFQETPSEEVFLKIKAQYPKPKGFLKTYKYHIAAGLAIIALSLATIYIVNNQTKPIETTNQTTNTIIEENKQIITNQNNINSETQILNNSQNNQIHIIKQNDLVINENKLISDVNENKNVVNEKTINQKVFETNDTVICGKSIEIPFGAKTNLLQLPKDIIVSKSDLGININSQNFGKYTIYYNDISNVFRDSITINFKNNDFAKVDFSNENICPNEDLIISIKNSNSNLVWGDTNFKVLKKSSSTYIIKNLKSGENLISFNLEENGCTQQISQKINVLKSPKYKIQTESEVCSKANGKLLILSDDKNINSFTLNNEITNSIGRFTNLNAGIYFVKIGFANSCYIADTVFISDSLNISPYFVSDRDLVNKNKYQFINYTRIDDSGFERNNQVNFIWKINDEEKSELDNFSYEFVKGGTYKIELFASLSETCQKSYSETIEISETNLRIPNIFTPNGDGLNDEFVVCYDGELVKFKIDITNKNGEVIFQSTDINKSWDGKINGNDHAADGVYYYNINGEDNFGNKIERRGALRLARH